MYEFIAAVDALYDFFWNEFCDWYIELAKVPAHGGTKRRRRGVASCSAACRPICGCCTP